MKSHWSAAILLAALPSLAAQDRLPPQDDWCVTVQDVCCDDKETVHTFVLPAVTSEVWVHYDLTSNFKAEVEVSNLDAGLVLYRSMLGCGCERIPIWNNVPHPIGATFMFKVSCMQCGPPDGECDYPIATVKFFSSGKHDCAPDCQEE